MRQHLARVAALIAALAAVATFGAGTATAATTPTFICHPQPTCRF